MPDVTGIVDGVMVVDVFDDDGEPTGETRPATVAEQTAAVLRALEGQGVL